MKIPFYWLKFFSIPSILMWDDRLSHIDCFIFAIIQIFDNKEGCQLSNEIIANLLGKPKGQQNVSNGIARLTKAGYIKSDIKKSKIDGQVRTQRIIWIDHSNFEKNRNKLYSNDLKKYDGFLTIRKIIVEGKILTITKVIGKEDNLLSSKEDNNESIDSFSSSPLEVNKKKRKRKKLPTIFKKELKKEVKKEVKKEKEDKKEIKKKTQFELAPAEDKNIILQWNRLKAGSRHTNKNSKLIKETLRLLPQLRKQYDYEDIIDAIIYHVQFRINGKMSILDFFRLNNFQKTYLQKLNKPLLSPFQSIIRKKDFEQFRKTKRYPKDLYEEIKSYWRKHITCEETEFSEKQENHFKLTAVKLKQYMKGKRLEKYIIEGCRPSDYVRALYHALDESWDGKFTTANLCSDYTFTDTLPRYISREWEE